MSVESTVFTLFNDTRVRLPWVLDRVVGTIHLRSRKIQNVQHCLAAGHNSKIYDSTVGELKRYFAIIMIPFFLKLERQFVEL